MKPPFTSSQEMYNYAANQLMNQGLSQEAVKNNLKQRGVSDADAEIVIQNMLVAIEKKRNAEGFNTMEIGAEAAENAFSARQTTVPREQNKYGSFGTMQEMYNYAADQLIVQNLSQQQVMRNLMGQGVSVTEAETVIANMMVQIQKNKPVETYAQTSTGSFASTQEMYNYAADQLIVKKLDRQTVKRNLMNEGLPDGAAEEVIKNMMIQIEKNKPAAASAKRSEGKRFMLVGIIIGAIGAILYGTQFNIAGEYFEVSYGIMAMGAILFFRGLFKMF